MNVIKSTIFFYYQRKRYAADVQLFKPVDTSQFWVHVKMGQERKDGSETVFVFYKSKPGELFWYDWNNEFKQGMATALASKLLKA